MKLIRVKARDQQTRRELARWSLPYKHLGVRTVSHSELGFPPEVFADIPERLLVGALVDSQPYQPAAKPARGRRREGGRVVLPRPAAVVDIPTGGQAAVTTPAVDAVTVAVDPVEDTTTVVTEPEPEPAPEQEQEAETPEVPQYACPEPGCGYTARSEHGLRIHTGRKHPTEESR